MTARLSARQAIVALVALAVIGVANPAAAANPSPGSLLIAKQIIEIKGVRGLFEPLVRGMIEKNKDVFMQTNFMWSKDINEVAAILHKDDNSRVNELVDMTAHEYANHFTETELKGMLTFYQSPLGQKMIVEEPKVMTESMADAGKWADDHSEEVMAKMRSEMKKRGHDM
jgi:hypothetical protein